MELKNPQFHGNRNIQQEESCVGAGHQASGFRGQLARCRHAARPGRRIRHEHWAVFTRGHNRRSFSHYELHCEDVGISGGQTGRTAAHSRGSGCRDSGFRVHRALRPISDAVHRGRCLRITAADRLANRTAFDQQRHFD